MIQSIMDNTHLTFISLRNIYHHLIVNMGVGVGSGF